MPLTFTFGATHIVSGDRAISDLLPTYPAYHSEQTFSALFTSCTLDNNSPIFADDCDAYASEFASCHHEIITAGHACNGIVFYPITADNSSFVVTLISYE